MDRWIEDGFAGEDRRRYDESLAQSTQWPEMPAKMLEKVNTLKELEQAEREGAEKRAELRRRRAALEQARLDDVAKRAELHRQFVAWLVRQGDV